MHPTYIADESAAVCSKQILGTGFLTLTRLEQKGEHKVRDHLLTLLVFQPKLGMGQLSWSLTYRWLSNKTRRKIPGKNPLVGNHLYLYTLAL